jgi:hypothetical protein
MPLHGRGLYHQSQALCDCHMRLAGELLSLRHTTNAKGSAVVFGSGK